MPTIRLQDREDKNRPPRKLKLFIKMDDGTKFKNRISAHIRKSKNQFPRKSNKKIPQSKMIEVGFYSVSISIFSI